MRRRNLLVFGGAAAAAFEIGRRMQVDYGPPADFELVSGYGKWVDVAIDEVDPPLVSDIVFFNPGSREMESFEVPFRMHTVVQNPAERDLMVLIPKWGKQICSFSRSEGRVVHCRTAGDGRRYFGHGVWDAGAGGFWVSEHDDREVQGYLTLRGPNLEILSQVRTFGIYPHDVQFASAGVLLVANNGDFTGRIGDAVALDRRISSMAWVRAADGVLVDKTEFPLMLNQWGASHFQQVASTGELFVGTKGSSPEQQGLLLRVKGHKVAELSAKDYPKRFRGELLSFACLEKEQKVVWTHSKAQGVFSCSLEPGSPVELLVPARARGLALVDDRLILSHASRQVLIHVNGKQITSRTRGPLRFGYRWGSHFSRVSAV